MKTVLLCPRYTDSQKPTALALLPSPHDERLPAEGGRARRDALANSPGRPGHGTPKAVLDDRRIAVGGRSGKCSVACDSGSIVTLPDSHDRGSRGDVRRGD